MSNRLEITINSSNKTMLVLSCQATTTMTMKAQLKIPGSSTAKENFK
jgi:hypothetical protein